VYESYTLVYEKKHCLGFGSKRSKTGGKICKGGGKDPRNIIDAIDYNDENSATG